MNCIDCFLAPVPRANKADYEELARISAKVVTEYGALNVIECWLDESGPDASSYHGAETKQSQVEYGSFVAAAGVMRTKVVSPATDRSRGRPYFLGQF